MSAADPDGAAWRSRVDRGGTSTDVVARRPDGRIVDLDAARGTVARTRRRLLGDCDRPCARLALHGARRGGGRTRARAGLHASIGQPPRRAGRQAGRGGDTCVVDAYLSPVLRGSVGKIAGGAGAGPDFEGGDAIQTHMTNGRMADPEILEAQSPLPLQDSSIRRGSGGDDATRCVRLPAPMTACILANPRRMAPFGPAGGQAGAPGAARIERRDRTVETPGGGGYGSCR